MANLKHLKILNQGVEIWNDWRKNNPDIEPNLRRANLKNKNLAKYDFSNSNLRSTNFTGADLTLANFNKAKAGLDKAETILLTIIPILLAIGVGFSFILLNPRILQMFDAIDSENQSLELIFFIILLGCLAIVVNRKLGNTAAIVSLIIGGIGIIFLASVKILSISYVAAAILIYFTLGSYLVASASLTVTYALVEEIAAPKNGSKLFLLRYIGAFAVFLFFVAIVVPGYLNKTVLISIALVAYPVTEAWIVAETRAVLIAGLVILSSYSGAYILAKLLTFNLIGGDMGGDNLEIFTVLFLGFSFYISFQALIGNPLYSFVRDPANICAAIGGTSFINANLTDANFLKARLKSTDFRGAILDRTAWHNVVMLDRIRPGSSYLQNPQIRKLLVTGQGINKKFDRLDLRKINLSGANLIQASFIDTDLRGANLCKTNLSRAKLIRTKLDKTNLTKATLTGVYIEDCSLTKDTILSKIKCQYVFKRTTRANSFFVRDWGNN